MKQNGLNGDRLHTVLLEVSEEIEIREIQSIDFYRVNLQAKAYSVLLKVWHGMDYGGSKWDILYTIPSGISGGLNIWNQGKSRKNFG